MPFDTSKTSMTSTVPLLEPITMGSTTLDNRVFMGPLTRSRSKHPQNTQSALHALYYAQRASAGLIVSEATQISQQGQGYAWTPGIHSPEQVECWKLVTDAVHIAGGRIFCQLWHVGAISHHIFQPNNGAPLSSSEFTPEGEAFVGDLHEDGPTVPHPTAKAMSLEEIIKLKEDYRHAARCAKKAGFDGVELHAANGYLLDQFMRSSVNKRDDEYGGSIENRIRLVGEILDVLIDELGANSIGIRLSPTGGAGGSYDDDPVSTYVAAAKLVAIKKIAYMHVVRPNSHTGGDDSGDLSEKVVSGMRDAFPGTFIANGGFSPSEANEWIAQGKADAIAFGRLFLANPDLPQRIVSGSDLNEPDQDTFYGGGAAGYVDYPKLFSKTSLLK